MQKHLHYNPVYPYPSFPGLGNTEASSLKANLHPQAIREFKQNPSICFSTNGEHKYACKLFFFLHTATANMAEIPNVTKLNFQRQIHNRLTNFTCHSLEYWSSAVMHLSSTPPKTCVDGNQLYVFTSVESLKIGVMHHLYSP